jgi:anti-anti-sigma regulatory factor
MSLQPSDAVEPHHGGSRSSIRLDLVGCRLEGGGPLDRGTVHLLHDAISTLLLVDGDVWVVDATGVTACDGAGIRGIGTACRRALRHGRRLRLVGVPPVLRRELARLRLDHHLLDDGGAVVPDPPGRQPAARGRP